MRIAVLALCAVFGLSVTAIGNDPNLESQPTREEHLLRDLLRARWMLAELRVRVWYAEHPEDKTPLADRLEEEDEKCDQAATDLAKEYQISRKKLIEIEDRVSKWRIAYHEKHGTHYKVPAKSREFLAAPSALY